MTKQQAFFQAKAQLLGLMANPVRLCILTSLCKQGRRNVTGLQECAAVPQSSVSAQLSKLKAAGLVSGERIGTEVYYELSNDEVRAIVELLLQSINQEE